MAISGTCRWSGTKVATREAASRHADALWSALHRLDTPLDLYYYFMQVWLMFHNGITSIRKPSMLAMVGTVAIASRTAQKLAGRQAGLLTVLLLLAKPAAWTFEAFARPYALALLAAAVRLHVLDWPPEPAAAARARPIMLYLQGRFVVLLLAEAVLVLRRRQPRMLAPIGGGASAVVAARGRVERPDGDDELDPPHVARDSG